MSAVLICMVVFALVMRAATVLTLRVTGPSGSQVLDVVTASIEDFNSADIAFDGTDHPIQIPASGGPNFSFWATHRLCCSAPPPTKINNIYVFSDGSNTLGMGVGCVVGTVSALNGDTTTNYVEATGIIGISGDELDNTSYPGVGVPVDWFSYISTAPLSIPGEFVTGVDTPGTGPAGTFGDWWIQQLTVDTSASGGVTPTEPGTLVWDEF